jgi:hypothetical protein
MASAELSRRVEKVAAYPPLSEMSNGQRFVFHEALLDADTFEDLPGKWQAAIVKASRAGRSCESFQTSSPPYMRCCERGFDTATSSNPSAWA